MGQIYFTDSVEQLKKIQQKHKSISLRVFDYYRQIPAAFFNENTQYKLLEPPVYSAQDKSQFLKSYVSFISQLSLQNKDLLWQATDLSSKNRFKSKLAFLLEEFLMGCRILDRMDEGVIVFFGFSSSVIHALNQAYGKSDRHKVVFGVSLIKVYFGALMRFLRSWGGVFYNALLTFYQMMIVRFYLKNYIRDNLINRKRDCYVLKTFSYLSSFTPQGYQDSFYGPLVPKLQREENLIIFTCTPQNFSKVIQQIKLQSQYIIIPVEAFVTIGDFFTVLKNILFAHFSYKEARFDGRDVSALLDFEMFCTFNGIQFLQYIHYHATVRLAQQIGIKTFVYTYENNPWEKMCVAALRERQPSSSIIAFQHNVIPQSSANMFIDTKMQDPLQPDKILTTGEEPRNILIENGSLPQDKIKTSCALRHEYLMNIHPQGHRPLKNILIGLEGIMDSYHVINYVLKQIEELKDYQFIIRTHPVLPFAQMENKLLKPIKGYPNITVSEGMPLQQDIERCDVLIYWGSTLALEALWVGKPVIHFDVMESILSFDPLFRCDCLKWNATARGDLRAILREIEGISQESFKKLQNEARQYLEEYFYKITENALNMFKN